MALILRAMGMAEIGLLNESFDSVEAQKYVGYNRHLIELYLNRHYPNTAKRIDIVNRIIKEITFDVLILQDSSLDLAYIHFSQLRMPGEKR